jgi:hypothetical protein
MNRNFETLIATTSTATGTHLAPGVPPPPPRFLKFTLSTYRYWAVSQLAFRLCMNDGFKQACTRHSALQQLRLWKPRRQHLKHLPEAEIV